jgi:hypothetical protein
MSSVVRVVGAVLLAGVAAFCAFGFVAAAEDAGAAPALRLLHGTAGAASLAGAAWLAWPRRLVRGRAEPRGQS